MPKWSLVLAILFAFFTACQVRPPAQQPAEGPGTPDAGSVDAPPLRRVETPKALEWSRSSVGETLYPGFPQEFALPGLTGGSKPYQLHLQKSPLQVVLVEGKLRARVGYDAKGPLSFEVIATDSQGKTASLPVKLALHAPRWKKLKPQGAAPKPRAEAGVARAGSRVLVLGGYLGLLPSGNAEQGSNDLWIYDLSSHSWSQAQSTGTIPPKGGSFLLAVTHFEGDGKPLEGVVVQGTREDYTGLPHLYRFRLEGKQVTWSKLASQGEAPPLQLIFSAMGHVTGSKELVIFGGTVSGSFKPSNVLYSMVLKDQTAVWKRVGEGGPSARWGMSYATDSVGKRLFIAGGDTFQSGSARYPTDVWALSLDSLSWSQVPAQGKFFGARSGALWWDAKGQRLFAWGGASGPGVGLELFSLRIADAKPRWETIAHAQAPDARFSAFYTTDGMGNGLLGLGRRSVKDQFDDLWSWQLYLP